VQHYLELLEPPKWSRWTLHDQRTPEPDLVHAALEKVEGGPRTRP
jgi:hypothetical protein